MKVIGIVAEYNPFHSGHAYQIMKAREQFGDDAMILAVMSGQFVQRGEPAIVSKWIRAQAALRCGADLVIEIPFTFACSSADRFAHGAISLLNAAGIVSDLYFGSESDDLSSMSDLADTLIEENPQFVDNLRDNLQNGQSYAKSRELALASYLAGACKPELAKACETLLNMPNSILAIEYLTELKKTGSSIKPSVLLRAGAGYHDDSLHLDFVSATGIRGCVSELRNNVTNTVGTGSFSVSSIAGKLAGKLPSASLSPMLSAWSEGIRPLFPTDFLPEILQLLRSRTTQQLDECAYMGDQVSRRLKNALANLRADPDNELLASFRGLSDSRRHAGTRISRALISLLCGQTGADLFELASPEYLRVLGFSEKGRYLLRLMRKSATLPIIDKASDFLEHGQNTRLKRMAELDLLSCDLWGLKAGYAYGDEFERSVIQIKEKQQKK